MISGVYNNTESQYGVSIKYVPSPGGVQTNTRMRHYHPRDKNINHYVYNNYIW